MKAFSTVLLPVVLVFNLQASQELDRARRMEESGDTAGARALLLNAAQKSPGNITALKEYAEFLDAHGDAATLDAYSKLLASLDQPAHQQQRAIVARRMAGIYLLRGDRAAAERSLAICREAGGTAKLEPAATAETSETGYVEVPGP